MSEQRQKILEEACELFLENGLDGFSMRKLAKAVGVTAPALYRHYENKEEVLRDVVQEAYRHFSTHLYRALEGKTPEERFFLAARGHVDFALKHPRLYDVLYLAPEHLGWESRPEPLASQICAIGQFWHDRVRECVDAGMLRAEDPKQLSLTLWAHGHGLVMLYLKGLLEVDDDGFRRLHGESARRLLRGVATPAYADELDAGERAWLHERLERSA